MALSDYPKEQREPVRLSGEEIRDPQIVFVRFFEYAHLPELKKMVQEIKEWLFNRNYPFSSNEMQHDNTEYFFERLESLFEAVYVFNNLRSSQTGE